LRDFIRQACLQKPDDIRQFAAGIVFSFYWFLLKINSFPKGYFTHPMLEKRIENLINEQIETVNADIKVLSEEIFQR
jgi:hypothetical protein